jgi:transposase-like protein
MFTADCKKRILAEIDTAAPGQTGAILRREGIYSSTLSGWRKERDEAVTKAFSQPRGPHPQRDPLATENERLRRQNERLKEELRKAEIIIDVEKKVAALLGNPLPPDPLNEKS